jgi:hypothetical protein
MRRNSIRRIRQWIGSDVPSTELLSSEELRQS